MEEVDEEGKETGAAATTAVGVAEKVVVAEAMGGGKAAWVVTP